MSKETIKENLILLCSEIFQNAGVDTDIIEYVDFVDDLGMDSITFITLVVEIEARFEIILPDDMLLMEYFKNVDSVAEIIIAQKKQSSGGECNDKT